MCRTRTKGFPDVWTDPDQEAAAALIKASRDLYAAGAPDLAEQASARAAGLFAGAPSDRSGALVLGRSKYYPAGILSTGTGAGRIDVPAPPFGADARRPEPAARPSGPASDPYAAARYGRFVKWQVKSFMGASRKPPFTPAKDLERVLAACRSCRPDAGPYAMGIAAGGLAAALDGHGKAESATWRGFSEDAARKDAKSRTDLRCVDPSRDSDRELAFAWLDEGSLADAARWIGSGGRPAGGAPLPSLTAWRAPAGVYGTHGDLAGAARDRVLAVAKGAGPVALSYLDSMWSRCLSAAWRLTSKLRMHEALLRCGDERLLAVLSRGGIAVPGLAVPEGTFAKAALIRSYGKFPGSDQVARYVQPDRIAAGRKAIIEAVAELERAGAFEWRLVPAET